MAGLGKQLRRRSEFNHVPSIHDADAICDLGQKAKIMRDIKHRHVEPSAKVDQ